MYSEQSNEYVTVETCYNMNVRLSTIDWKKYNNYKINTEYIVDFMSSYQTNIISDKYNTEADNYHEDYSNQECVKYDGYRIQLYYSNRLSSYIILHCLNEIIKNKDISTIEKIVELIDNYKISIKILSKIYIYNFSDELSDIIASYLN
jgi:hypothetical protein